jgi:hypothetical protein
MVSKNRKLIAHVLKSCKFSNFLKVVVFSWNLRVFSAKSLDPDPVNPDPRRYSFVVILRAATSKNRAKALEIPTRASNSKSEK